MRVLNLYAGIGGNRKLWGDEHEVTAVEIDPVIAEVYHSLFPNDRMVVGDAHQYLLDHYSEYDFIWSSPPCPTHSDIRRMSFDAGICAPVYPDMVLYQEIIFLKHFFKGKWVVENVQSYYDPLIKPFLSGRHYFWSNFVITDLKMPPSMIKDGQVHELEDNLDMDLSNIEVVGKRQLLRNCVHPKLGLHVFKCAFKEKQRTL